MSQPKVEITDPVVAGIALGKRPQRSKDSSGYRLATAAPQAPLKPVSSSTVVLGVRVPNSSSVRTFR